MNLPFQLTDPVPCTVLTLVTAVVWSLARRHAARSRFEPISRREPENIYEIAFLSAGPSRVMLTAVISLLTRELAVLKKFKLNHRLVPGRASEDAFPLTPEEFRLLQEVRSEGELGLAFQSMWSPMDVRLTAIETQLAIGGLRPTRGEWKRAAGGVIVPMILPFAACVLFLISAIRSGDGMLWMFLLLMLTGVITTFLNAGTPRLTSHGKSVLTELRLRHRDLRHIPHPPAPHDTRAHSDLLLALALFGPAAIRHLPGYDRVLEIAQRDLHDPGHTQWPYSRSRSGCGTLGCGGGGCGTSGTGSWGDWGGGGCGGSGCGGGCGGGD